MTDLKAAIRRNRYEAWHKAAGLCRDCPEKSTHGVFCRKHWLMAKARKRRYRTKLTQRRYEAGLCTSCGVTLDEEDAPKTCVNCTRLARVRPERKGRMR